MMEFQEVIKALEKGEVRVAEKTAGGWKVNSWVKEAILEGRDLTADEKTAAHAEWAKEWMGRYDDINKDNLDTIDMPAMAASPYTPAATLSISVAMLARA